MWRETPVHGISLGIARKGAAKALSLHGALRCNGYVDEELRRELLARREEDQRIRHLAAARSDPDTGRLHTTWLSNGSASIKTTPDGLLICSAARQPGMARSDARRCGGSPGGLAPRPARGPRPRPAARIPGCPARSIHPRGGLPRRTWPTWKTESGSMPGSLSSTAPSSPSPARRSGSIRSRIPGDSASAGHKPGLNRSLTTKPQATVNRGVDIRARHSAMNARRAQRLRYWSTRRGGAHASQPSVIASRNAARETFFSWMRTAE
jgi:hypothetical protein